MVMFLLLIVLRLEQTLLAAKPGSQPVVATTPRKVYHTCWQPKEEALGNPSSEPYLSMSQILHK